MKNIIVPGLILLGSSVATFAAGTADAATVASADNLAATASAIFTTVSGVVITVVAFGIMLSLAKYLKRK